MSKGSSSITDFPVAPRRQRAPSTEKPADPAAARAAKVDHPAQAALEQDKALSSVQQRQELLHSEPILSTPEARRERATAKSLEREDARLRLHHLKQNKARESKHFVNCPLDYDTKKRLERAASENDVKMTVIVKAAIDQFLRDNGY
jgi:hypothetical protein